ncbi:MAG TPA: heme-binding protein [Polyangiaceae bacterium]|jgi:hypothetical protein|nr:heme-binding protein [Polyangiaceae bacterium]
MNKTSEGPGCPMKRMGHVPPRFQQGPLTTALQLGPLAFLAGSWRGPGFNAIWRPDNSESPENSATHRFLELNLTHDSFDFTVIPGVVPNRGFNAQADLNLYGLHYLQRVSDADPAPSPMVSPAGYSQTAGQALHIEPGLIMNVPASQQPATGGTLVNQPTIVRMASIPHGVTVLMQGPNPGTTPTPGKPNIPPVTPFTGYPGLSPQPFPGPYTVPAQPAPVPQGPNPPAVGIQPITTAGAQHVIPEINIGLDTLAPNSQSTGPFPSSFQGFIDDPNSVLRDAIANQEILGFLAINLTTDLQSSNGFPTLGAGSLYETVSNIPFLGVANPTPPAPLPSQPATAATAANPVPNAFVYSASVTFWIEWVLDPGAPPVPLNQGGPPPPQITQLEPFWGRSTHLQLQYSQVVMLMFNNILWPHVTVGTLTLSAG